MGRSKSSDRWMKEHVTDYYVQKAQQDGYRSRAAYKLLELNERDRLLKPGTSVVDLGSAPGGWSQVAAGLVGEQGRVYALDILPMDALADVSFIQGDFCEQEVLDQLLELIGDRKINLVISDMAPNISGVGSVDQAKSVYLCELALDFSRQVLSKGGDFAIKVFQGEGFDEFMRETKASFGKVHIRKPKASRPRSREVYIVARDFKM
ncbi:23S rRNA (uridine(2552)-2'-O)-methyltransferase RlmE [Pseudomonadota bacterium]